MCGDWIKRNSPFTVELGSCESGGSGYEVYRCENDVVYEDLYNNSKCAGKPFATLTIKNGANPSIGNHGACFANPLTPWPWYYVTTWKGPNCGIIE